ncbi:MAG TPA: PKD domain-containing protein [Chitinophagaceae bacterium]|nr:PKD domain-containing protein [Chitinophagaceae bacterium]
MIKRILDPKRIICTLCLLLTLLVAKAQYGNIEFIENKGQWDRQVKFRGNVPSGAFFVRSTGFTVLQHNPGDLRLLLDRLHSHGYGSSGQLRSIDDSDKIVLHSHAYQVDFQGASPDIEVIPDKPLDTYNNYFLGNDPAKWASNCRVYQGITVKNIYPNVDVRYYTQNGSLKYDIIARPGADISRIAMKYTGADKLAIRNKGLSITTSVGEVKEMAPYSYQFDGTARRDLNCKFSIDNNNVVRFELKNYDPSATIVIDPTLVFITFTGSKADNWGYTATYGPDGSMFGGGIVFDTGFPVSTGAFEENFNGGLSENQESGFDIGIIKLSPNGVNRIYATYIGGSGNEQPHSLVVDGAGNLILAGRSNSINYPTVPAGSVIGPGGNYDIVVTKLNAAGTALIGSKRIGGAGSDGVNITTARGAPNSLQRNYGDDGRSEVILDNSGNIYVASCTQSLSTDVTQGFPIVGGFQATPGGGNQDGVILKLTPDVSTLLFSSYLGGEGDDAAYVLSLSPTTGTLYVGGGTTSTKFPASSSGVISSSNNGAIDGFVAEVSPDGSTLLRATYLGTANIDQVYGLKFDKFGFPYVMGQTYGSWPHINAPYYDAGAKQFIAKLKPDLSAFVYSTVFGKSASVPSISPVAFLVDRCENVYISGWGGTFGNYQTSGTSGMPVTPDAFQSRSNDNMDFYFFVMKKDATAQLFGSFLGETGPYPDHVDGGTSRFDQNGVIYQAICGNCEPPPAKPVFPTTPGVWAPVNGSDYCNLALVKIAFNLAGVGAGLQASINGVPRDTAGCVPLTVDFKDTIHNAVSYHWDFGDGSPVLTTTVPNTSHTYNAVGFYTVMLVAVDSSTCNISDTAYTHIRVGNNQAVLKMTPVKLNPCDSFKYQFNNLSTAPAGLPFTSQSFVWDFGDGTPRITTGTGPVFHNYAGPGTYNVRLILVDSNYCNAPDSIQIQLRVAALVKAQFETPLVGCAPYTAVFNNTSLAGQSFSWNFGDGTTSTEISPVHQYNTPGDYTVTLIANDPNTCNLSDTATAQISVSAKPVANFSVTPVPPVENTPNTFTNLSSPDAVSFIWNFGDGDTIHTSTRTPVVHQYNATGTFTACLAAFNAAGCSDTLCKQVETIVNPLVDVPNAFTPNSGGINSQVKVRGFGIARMKFSIWNRWGQKVFETNDPNIGWDGKFKGVLQPMDVYAYTLDVQFFDGTKTTRKGDITLIR